MQRAFVYDSSGLICFKKNIRDEYEVILERLLSAIKNVSPEWFYKEKITTTITKNCNILKKFLSLDCHHLYVNLAYKN